MPSFTKKAILESFLHLVGKKPLEKITVRDIVDDCGINRNTFYYYFQDIYGVLEDLCASLFQDIPSEQSLCVTLCAFYRIFSGFVSRYPHAAKSLALSLGFEGMERYLATGLDGLILDCYARGVRVLPSPTALRFLRHGLLGLCLDTMRGECSVQPTLEELEKALVALPLSDLDKI